MEQSFEVVINNLKTNYGKTLVISSISYVDAITETFYCITDKSDGRVLSSFITTNISKANVISNLKDYLTWNENLIEILNNKEFSYKIKWPNKTEDQIKNQKNIISNQIQKFIAKGKKNGDIDYLSLKSGGFDQFSLLKINELVNLVSPSAINISDGFSDKDKAIMYRWVLRGLPPKMAKRKVELHIKQGFKFIKY